MKLIRKPLVFASIFAVLFAVTGCYKKKDTVATITVVNATNAPQGGQEVTLTYIGSDPEDVRIEQVATTDASGNASFNFNDLYKSGQAGFAVLDIYVQGQVVGIIKIEEETTSKETVVL